MGLFNKKEERSYNIGITEILSANNIYINESTALSIPVVHESINKIANQIAGMPIYLYQEDNKGTVKRYYGDIKEILLNEENNEFESAYTWKYKLIKDLLLYGRSYHYIQRNGNKIEGLHHVPFTTVTEQNAVNDAGIIINKDIHYTLNNRSLVDRASNFIIVDTGNKGILNSTQLLELLQKHNELQLNSYDNIARPSGLLKAKGRMTKDAIENLRTSWGNLYKGSNNTGKTVILEEGLEYQPLTLSISDLHMNDTKNELVKDIERLFGLYQNTDTYDKFLKMVLSGYINTIECSLNKSLLFEKEKKKGLFFRFDTSELLRPNTKEQFEMYSLAVKSGLMTLEECRAALDLERFFDNETSDKLIMSLGNVFLERNGDIQIPNMGINMDADGTVEKTLQSESIQGELIG